MGETHKVINFSYKATSSRRLYETTRLSQIRQAISQAPEGVLTATIDYLDGKRTEQVGFAATVLDGRIELHTGADTGPVYELTSRRRKLYLRRVLKLR